jgi:hypothetical protein
VQGILINPFDQTIKKVEYEGDFREIYDLIDCNTFDVVMLCDADDLYVDDEGLLKDNRYFSWSGRIFAGKGLILGHNEEGETTSTSYDLQEVVDRIEWLPEGYREEPYMEFVSWN